MQICAAEGSSVDMSCDYTYPGHLTVQRDFWTTENSQNPPDIINDNHYNGRITADCGDLQSGHCTLTIQGVKKGDGVMYYCRITTNEDKEKWIGIPGVTLEIAGNILPPSYHQYPCR